MSRAIKIFGIGEFLCDLNKVIVSLGINNSQIIDNMVWDAINPDYVVVNERIYSEQKYLRQLKKYYTDDRIIIMNASEALSPDLNIFDYVIGFDTHYHVSDRVARIPTMVRFAKLGESNLITKKEAKLSLNSDKGFCSFIYSNPNAHKMRDILFDNISKYKKVDSLGRYRHNTDIESSRYSENWEEISIHLKNNYKFSIACENALFAGYTSEKLITSFKAHTVPIYWGNPFVDEEFNKNAFINCHKYRNIDDLLEEIKRIDQDDDAWAEMVSSPWQTEKQMKIDETQYAEYMSFLDHIFLADVADARRRPMGTFADTAVKHFFNEYSCFAGIVSEMKVFVKFVLKKLNISRKG